jgi:hypothetical protein
MVVPLLNLIAMWQHASAVEQITKQRYPGILMWVLWIFVMPAVWVLVQLELNRIADDPNSASRATNY